MEAIKTLSNSLQDEGESESEGLIPRNLNMFKPILPIAAVSALMHTFMMLETHIYVPYLYSRVSCCNSADDMLQSAYDVTDPDLLKAMRVDAHKEGVHLSMISEDRIAACSVPTFPKSSNHWSMSAHCSNKAYVQQSAQGVMAVMKPLQKLFGFMFLPLGGALADTFGRQPILALYAGGLCLACLLLSLDAQLQGAWGNILVYASGCLLGLSFQPKDTILSAAVADILGNNQVAKCRTFVGLRSLDGAISLATNVAVYLFLTHHPEAYVYPWLAFASLALLTGVFVCLVMKETLKTKVGNYDEAHMEPQTQVPLPGFLRFPAWKAIWKDEILLLQAVLAFFFYAYFLGSVTVKTSYLSLIGFHIEDTLLPEIIASLTIYLAAPILLLLLKQVGVFSLSICGNLIFAGSFFFLGPYTYLVSDWGPYLAAALFQLALLVVLPAFQTIISDRLEPDIQAEGQAAISAIGTLGGVVGIPLYNAVLFDATAHGFQKTQVPCTSLVLAVLCAGLALVIKWRAGSNVGPQHSWTSSFPPEESMIAGEDI